LEFNKIVLGTAQIDGNYGVARENSIFDIKKILKICKTENILFLDTSQKYNNAHNILSNYVKKDFNIITKISFADIKNEYLNKEIVKRKLEEVFISLKQNQINSILLHDTNILKTKYADYLIEELNILKKNNKIKYFGISIYELEELESFYDLGFDIIQGPLNILDRRIIDSGWLEKIHLDQKEFHARSIFLQGLLSQDKKQNIPIKFHKWEKFWNDWFSWHRNNNIKPIQSCLSYALNNESVAKTIIGVDNEEQLNNLINICKNKLLDINMLKDLMKKTINDEYLINPKNWKTFK
tara:strand:- start:73 stop:960 length:888 start_codon:yes stop_codon:yes gene_type:complete